MQVLRRNLHLSLPLPIIPRLQPLELPKHASKQIARLHQRLLPPRARPRAAAKRHELDGLRAEGLPAIGIELVGIEAPDGFLAVQDREVAVEEGALAAEDRALAVRPAARRQGGVRQGDAYMVWEDGVEAQGLVDHVTELLELHGTLVVERCVPKRVEDFSA